MRKLSKPLREKLDEIVDWIFDKASKPIWSYSDGTDTVRRRPLTVPMLAARAGVTTTTVRRLMNRETQFPRWDTVQKLLWAVSMDTELCDVGSIRAIPLQSVTTFKLAQLKRMAA